MAVIVVAPLRPALGEVMSWLTLVLRLYRWGFLYLPQLLGGASNVTLALPQGFNLRHTGRNQLVIGAPPDHTGEPQGPKEALSLV